MSKEPTPPNSDELYGPLITWSADMRIAVVFSKQQAAEAEKDPSRLVPLRQYSKVSAVPQRAGVRPVF
jgi:hypothetical protein